MNIMQIYGEVFTVSTIPLLEKNVVTLYYPPLLKMPFPVFSRYFFEVEEIHLFKIHKLSITRLIDSDTT